MTDSEVGYKSPPRHTQFKPGNNANPIGRGARKGAKPREIVRKVLDRLETVSIGSKRTKLTRLERVVRKFGHDALRGNVESALFLLELRKYSEMIGDMRPIMFVITEDDLRL